MGHLFFYGTLTHEHRGAWADWLRPLLNDGRRASVSGRLFAIGTPQGWYPGLVPGTGRVEGWVYRCRPGFGRDALATLDRYEGFDRRRPGRSEYVRRTMPVTPGRGGSVLAQVYVWNAPPRSAAFEIASGSFARFLAETGLPAFGAEGLP